MALPTIDAYAFPVVQPSTGKSVNMRPFLVREEKLLLMAQESEDYQQQAESVAQVIRNCTDGAIDPTKVPFFDVEYLLLQLRARSVGEVTSPIYVCHHKDDPEGPECGHRTKIDIDLTKVTVDLSARKDTPTAHILPISPRYTLFLRDPNIYHVNELLHILAESGGEITTKVIDAMVNLFDVLKDGDTGTVYAFDDYTDKEKVTFMEGLTHETYTKISEFMRTIPTIAHTVNYTCEQCQTAHTFTISGLTDFLGSR